MDRKQKFDTLIFSYYFPKVQSWDKNNKKIQSNYKKIYITSLQMMDTNNIYNEYRIKT